MLNALGEMIFDAIQKQIAERQDVAPPGAGVAPLQGLPSGTLPARSLQNVAPVAAPPVAKPPVAMGRIPDAAPANFFPPLELAVSPPAAAFTNPLLEALRGGPALIGGIVVAQVLGPPASLRPHTAPTDTL